MLANAPEFYQWLIDPLQDIKEQINMSMAHGIKLETLFAFSDGSVKLGKGAHGWIFASETSPILQDAGPEDGHPDYMSSYRSELGG